jgi:hypothetical protein
MLHSFLIQMDTTLRPCAEPPLVEPPNKPLQRSGLDKVHGRGRGHEMHKQVLRARVLRRQWPVAERGCLAAFPVLTPLLCSESIGACSLSSLASLPTSKPLPRVRAFVNAPAWSRSTAVDGGANARVWAP